MKKLRLIKPWQLRTIRQRLCDERMVVEETACSFAPCRGPEACIEYSTVRDARDFREENTICENNHYALKAPVSNLIFVPANIRG